MTQIFLVLPGNCVYAGSMTKHPNRPLRIFGYGRVSTSSQTGEDRFSLPAQRRILEEYATRRGATFTYYEDAGVSGETLQARPAMQRMLADVRAGKADLVLVVEPERLSRSTDLQDWISLRRIFREAGVRWGTPSQIFNPEDPEDEFLTFLFGALSAREKSKLIQRSLRGRIESARSGRWVAAFAPYGYRRGDDGRLVVEPREAKTVRFIFDALVSKRYSLRRIARLLAARHVLAPRGKAAWSASQLARIVANEVYIGHGAYKGVRIPVPPIVSEEMFRRARAQIKANTALSPRNVRRFYLLRGLVWCACGMRMVGNPNRGNTFYVCTSKDPQRAARPCGNGAISASWLDAAVWNHIVRRHVQEVGPEWKAMLTDEYYIRAAEGAEVAEAKGRLAEIQKALAGIVDERERIQVLFRVGAASLAEVQRHLSQVERKKEALEEEAHRLEAVVSARTVSLERAKSLEEIRQRVRDRLGRLSAAERFEVVHEFLERVTVHPFDPATQTRKIEVQGYYPEIYQEEAGPGLIRELEPYTESLSLAQKPRRRAKPKDQVASHPSSRT